MTRERFEEIIQSDSKYLSMNYSEDNTLLGLNIIVQYCPTKGVEGAQHDIIYSVDADELVEAGITEKHAEMLRDLNWIIDEGSLACYV